MDKDALQMLRASKFGQLTVSTLMERTIRSEATDASAELVASLLMEGFGSVPIVNRENQLLGIVSEFDLLNTIRQGNSLARITAGDIMTTSPISVTPDTDVSTAIQVLHTNHLIRVPVVDSVGNLVGIIARRDILRGYLQTSPTDIY